MLSDLIIYILKSVICSGLLFGYYMLVLKNKKINGFNRWYLLGSAVLSAVLPLLDINILQIDTGHARSFPLLQIMRSGSIEKDEMMGASASTNWNVYTVYAYFFIALCMLLSLAFKVAWVYNIKRRFGAVRMDNCWLIETSLSVAPFSFGNMLFWNEGMSMESEEGKKILMHEMAHIRGRHTVDKVLMQTILSMCWLNPFFWLMRKELWLQHEFIADGYAIEDGDTEGFAMMLLSVQGIRYSSVVNSFYYSPIKRRLMMLTKSKMTMYGKTRKFLVVPLLLLTVFIFSFTIKENTAGVARAEQKITVVLDAAHGGEDPGGKGLNGVQEKDISLRMCRKIMALAGEYNIEIIPTRENDVYPKLQERVDISNRADADLFLSIHVNKGPEGGPAGMEYELGVSERGTNYAQSLKLASAILPRINADGIMPVIASKGNIMVLSKNIHPALLIECGSLDDAANLERLADEKRLEALCRNILSGIVDYGAAKN